MPVQDRATVSVMRRDQVRNQLGLPRDGSIQEFDDICAANELAKRHRWMLGIKAENLEHDVRNVLPVAPNPHYMAAPSTPFRDNAINTVIYRERSQKALDVHEFRDVYLASSGNNFSIFRKMTLDLRSMGVVREMRRLHTMVVETVDIGAFCDDHYRAENPCHVIVDRLPRAEIFKSLLGIEERQCMFAWRTAPYASFAREAVFPDARFLDPDTVYRFRRLLVLSSTLHARGQGHPFWYLNPAIVEAIVPRIRRAAGLTDAAPRQKLYFARTDATRRPLVNELELTARLDRMGFQSVAMGTLSPREQLVMTSSAAVIVAPHGAALINLLGAAPGAKVVELFNPDKGTAAYTALAQQMGLRYAPVFGMPVAAADGAIDAWWIDIDAVEAAVRD